jgi:hypothetical protein
MPPLYISPSTNTGQFLFPTVYGANSQARMGQQRYNDFAIGQLGRGGVNPANFRRFLRGGARGTAFIVVAPFAVDFAIEASRLDLEQRTQATQLQALSQLNSSSASSPGEFTVSSGEGGIDMPPVWARDP